MNLERLLAFLKISLHAHILNWFWLPKHVRRTKRTDVLAKYIPQYFKRYLPVVASVPVTQPIKNDGDEKIYSIWLQGPEDSTPIVDACLRSVAANCIQEHVVLDEKTMFNYIDLPGYIMDKRANGQIGFAHFADIARIELLHNHGGFWADATLFFTKPIPQDITDSDFFLFKVRPTGGSSWRYAFVQNFFIRARRGDYLLDAWRAMILEYWKKEPNRIDYMMHQLIFKTLVENNKIAKEHFDKMPQIYLDATHQVWFGHRDKDFDQELFDQLTRESFFQKTKHMYGEPTPRCGTFVDAMIKMYPKE